MTGHFMLIASFLGRTYGLFPPTVSLLCLQICGYPVTPVCLRLIERSIRALDKICCRFAGTTAGNSDGDRYRVDNFVAVQPADAATRYRRAQMLSDAACALQSGLGQQQCKFFTAVAEH